MHAALEKLAETLGYALSLPERTVRALAASIGGTTKLLTDSLFPETLRGSTFYRIVVGDVQRFVIEHVGSVPGQFAPAAAAGADPAAAEAADADAMQTVQRKVASQALDAVGLFAMHVSPLWIFAIAADVSAGGRVYFTRLVDALKRQGVLDESSSPTSIEHLLVHLQSAAAKSAETLDQPPVSRDEAVAAARELLTRYRDAFAGVTDLMPRIDRLWDQMKSLAVRESVSVERLSGLMTLDVVRGGRRAVDTVLAVGTTTGQLIGETILADYGRTLTDLHRQGVFAYTQQRLQPFVDAAVRHFDAHSSTWTQRALGWLAGTFGLAGRAADAPPLASEEAVAAARQRMVEEQIRARGVHDERVLDAMLAVPRERFVLTGHAADAYEDRALPIGAGQTISQPYMVAAMTAALRLEPTHRVLEIGTGSGYQTAILARLAAEVFTIERHEPLARAAESRLADLACTNVRFRVGDGTLGWPDEAPFDRILVTAGAPQTPQPLIDQLAEGGRLVVPVGRGTLNLLLVERREGRITERSLMSCRFVPLIGRAGWSEVDAATLPDE